MIKSAAADRNDDDVEILGLLEQLETGRSRVRANVLVVERMDEREVALFGQLARASERVVSGRAVQHDLGAVSAARFDLGR